MKKNQFIGKTLETSIREAGFNRESCIGDLTVLELEYKYADNPKEKTEGKEYALERCPYSEEKLLQLATMVINFYSHSYDGKDTGELYIIPRKVNNEGRVFCGEHDREKFTIYSRKEEDR